MIGVEIVALVLLGALFLGTHLAYRRFTGRMRSTLSDAFSQDSSPALDRLRSLDEPQADELETLLRKVASGSADADDLRRAAELSKELEPAVPSQTAAS